MNFELSVQRHDGNSAQLLRAPRCWHCFAHSDSTKSIWTLQNGAIQRGSRIKFPLRDRGSALWVACICAALCVCWIAAAVQISRNRLALTVKLLLLASAVATILSLCAIILLRLDAGADTSGRLRFSLLDLVLCAVLSFPRVESVNHHLLWASGLLLNALLLLLSSHFFSPSSSSSLFWQECAVSLALVLSGFAVSRHVAPRSARR
mmetsp:Transcript_4145/g.9834  ORF Transcript_4145/g.9834 Transcript_4145/m.9834 type:complete len:206 (-) Transcript_4145:1939-2556(-)